MKKEDLFDVLGDINSQYIEEAHRDKVHKNRFAWVKWATVAACFVMVLTAGMLVVNQLPAPVAEEIPGTEDSQGATISDYVNQLQLEKEEHVDKEEALTERQADHLLVVNEVNAMGSALLDAKYTSHEKLPESVWRLILEEFYEYTGVRYEDFLSNISGTWECVNFYSVSVRGYKDGWLEDEYRLHDYVFHCRTSNGGEATIALCTFETPLRDYYVKCENPKQSEINGVPLFIYRYEDMYMVQFSYENINYDIETSNAGLEELEDLLNGILATSEPIPDSVEDSLSSSDIAEAPADANGSYVEAVGSDDLTKKTAEFFGGSYIDNSGRFVVVLTQDTPENRASICEELGISESNITFRTGTYTLAYLTELQAKISNAMMNRELPFVMSSGVYETVNKIKVSVTTNDETELDKLYALDAIGGAIEIAYVTEDSRIELEPLKRNLQLP